MARPERFELPTTKFVAWYSIQLSYGRVVKPTLLWLPPENRKAPKQEAELFRYWARPSILFVKFF